MEKDFYIFRHGQTDANLKNIWQGCMCDFRLNATGKRQASDLAKKMKDVNLDIIYSSPLRRAKQTALYVAKRNSFSPKVEIIEDLREGNFGEAEGYEIDCLIKRFPEIVEKFMYPTRRTWNIAFPGKGSESKQQIFDRVIGAVKEIAYRPGNVIGIATHGGVLNALACGLNLPKTQFDNCDVIHLRYNSTGGIFTFIE